MTATRTAPAPYRSGFCGSGVHDRCRGTYPGAVCDCPCHQKPEPDPEPEPVVVAVNCFFNCGHTVWSEDSWQAHEDMEQHYRVEHWPDIRAAVGWVTA